MRNTTKNALVVLLLTVLAAAGRAGMTRQGGGIDSSAKPTLSLTTTKQWFVRLEPIPILLSLKNESSKTVEVASVLNFEGPYLELYVAGDDRRMTKMEGLTSDSILIGPGHIKLMPEESYEEKNLLTLGGGRYFPKAGAYRIQAVLHDSLTGGRLKSNVMGITVLEPEGVDSEAFHYLMSDVDPASFFEKGASLSPDKAEEFVQRFGSSRYGDYATYLLGKYYLGQQKFDKSARHLAKLLDKSDFVFAEKARNYYAMSEKMKDKKDRDEK